MAKADSDEALNVFSEWFEEDHPAGYYTKSDGYHASWRLRVTNGVGVLRVVMEDMYSLDVEEFEWELNLRS